MQEYDSKQQILSIISDAEGQFQNVWDDVKEDSLFESGNQWDSTEKSNREKSSLPVLTTNIVRANINRIVNPYLKNPYSIEVQDEGLAKIVDDVEEDQCAVKKYYDTYRHQTTTGYGFLYCKTAYESDTSADLKLEIEALKPWECAIDLENDNPKWAVIKRTVPIASARDLGYESPNSRDGNDYFEQVEVYIVYNLKQSKVRRLFDSNGGYKDQDIELEIEQEGVSREITTSKLCETIVINNQIIGEPQEYNSDEIPIVVMLGEYTLKNDDTGKGSEFNETCAGMVYRQRDSQIQTNRMNSILQEVMEMLPDAPYVATPSQVKGLKKYWEKKPGTRHSVKLYNEVSTNTGQPLAPPSQAPVQQNIGLALQVKQNATQDMARTGSVTDQMVGEGEQSGVESGVLYSQKTYQGEIATIVYTFNQKEALRKFGRIILKMNGAISGDIVRVGDQIIPINSYMQIVDKVEIDVVAGPAEQERSIRNQALLNELMMQNEELIPLFQLEKVKESDLKNKDVIIKIMKAKLPPELQDPEDTGGVDPEAQAALTAANQVNQQLQQQLEQITAIAQQLQTQLIDNDKDREVDLAEAQIKANTDLAKIEADMIKNSENNASSERQTVMKEQGANERKQADIVADTQKQNKQIVTDVVKEASKTQPQNDAIIPSAPKKLLY